MRIDIIDTQQWLPKLASVAEDDDTLAPPEQTPRSKTHVPESQEDLFRRRQLTLSASLFEIRSRSSPEENQCVIENITLLQRDLRNQASTKRYIQSQKSESENPLQSDADDNLLHGKRTRSRESSLMMAYFSSVSCSQDSSHMRPPLVPLDMNIVSAGTHWKKWSSNQSKRHERTLQMKAWKKEKSV